jgi:uncharacterized protein (DUF433 family)
VSQSRITRRPDTMAGAYCIKGTRIPVHLIKGAARDWDAAKIMREWPGLTEADIAAALAFRRRGIAAE